MTNWLSISELHSATKPKIPSKAKVLVSCLSKRKVNGATDPEFFFVQCEQPASVYSVRLEQPEVFLHTTHG